jgi:hypothetical protein
MGTARKDAFTTFVLEVGDRWFLVTAGHVLKRIEAMVRAPDVASADVVLFDYWSEDAKCRFPVPFDLGSATKSAVDEDGLDVGVIELGLLYRRQLESNGVIALDQRAWRNPPQDVDGFFLIGLPSTFIRPIEGGLEISPTLVSLRATEAPEGTTVGVPRFYGQLAPTLRREDGEILVEMDGFSGGPILGFKQTERGLVYYVIAIQSTWRRDVRVVAAVLVSAVGSAIELAIRSFGGLPHATSEGSA